MARILIVDDDAEICDAIANVVNRMEHEPVTARTFSEGLEAAASAEVDVALVDVRLPDGNGLELLPLLREQSLRPEVIIMTGFGDADGAELAIKNGAWDYVEKPFSIKQLRLALARALQYQQEKTRRHTPAALERGGIIGESPALRGALELMAKAAASEVNVLLTGETGTGKELFALAVHENSDRAGRSFVVVDCTALPANLVESVLFGHVKGAFTGADREQEGLISQANGGTIFLDEVGELPLEIQKKFLRVLQERTYRRVGGKRERVSDFRLVAATNRDLDEMVESGEFREDLLFRLRALTIELPPLRERREDIKPLALHYITGLCEQYGTETKGFSPDFFDVLAAHEWPGNVRELFQALEQAMASAGPEPVLFPKDLPTELRVSLARKSIGEPSSGIGGPLGDLESLEELPSIKELRDGVLAEVEVRYLRELLARSAGDIKKCCEISGLSRSRLYALLKEYGIRSPRARLR
jgi:two-component system NtrC family response regulator